MKTEAHYPEAIQGDAFHIIGLALAIGAAMGAAAILLVLGIRLRLATDAGKKQGLASWAALAAAWRDERVRLRAPASLMVGLLLVAGACFAIDHTDDGFRSPAPAFGDLGMNRAPLNPWG